MPVILTEGTMPLWLGDTPLPEGELRRLVHPIDASLMESRPVSRYMSNSRNEGPECLSPPPSGPPPEPELNFG